MQNQDQATPEQVNQELPSSPPVKGRIVELGAVLHVFSTGEMVAETENGPVLVA